MFAGVLRGLGCIAVACLTLLVSAHTAEAEQAETHEALDERINALYTSKKYNEALPLAQRLLQQDRLANGEGHIATATGLNWLGILYDLLGRHAEAESNYKEAISVEEKALGPDAQMVGSTVLNLARLYRTQNRTGDAQVQFKRALAIREKASPPDALGVAGILEDIGGTYLASGRWDEAPDLLRRALRIRQDEQGADHPDVAVPLMLLSLSYAPDGLHSEAEALSRRALAIREKAYGTAHVDVLLSLLNLSGVLSRQRKNLETKEVLERALKIYEGLESQNPAYAINILGGLQIAYSMLKSESEAEAAGRRALAMMEQLYGKDDLRLVMRLNNLAALVGGQGRFDEAIAFAKRGRDIAMRHGSDSDIIRANLGIFAFRQGNWSEAVPELRFALGSVLGRDFTRSQLRNQGLHVEQRREMDGIRQQAFQLIKAAYRVDQATRPDKPSDQSKVGATWSNFVLAMNRVFDPPAPEMGLDEEMFQIRQASQASKAAGSIAQMAARAEKNDPAIAAIVRERQDLVAEWQALDKAEINVIANAEAAAANTNRARTSAIEARIAEIDKILSALPAASVLPRLEFVHYRKVQSDLRPHEALVFIADTPEDKPTPEETFIWVVTKTDFRWVRASVGTAGLARDVAALRCGLDPFARSGADGAPCDGPTRAPGTVGPFDTKRAHALYKALFGEVEDLIAGKDLLIASSGALQQLPFQVLITEPPSEGKSPAWLLRRHAITVLPSVKSLEALRAQEKKPAVARRPYLAIANPVLDGDSSSPKDKAGASLAALKSDCTTVAKLAFVSPKTDNFMGRDEAGVSAEAGIDAAALRRLKPVPQTADLVCNVAKVLGAAEGDVFLGGNATETRLKALNASGALASYAVVNFATHGAVSGELSANAEPGLVLTGTKEDDGYLSASEVASLKLDADWVILSACNTAAGGAANAEALSGLARAFFYAGARSLLVSHWAVRETAAVALITKAMAATAADKTLGRAEAMRRAMIELADKPNPAVAHPSYWAPFVVVGEGAPDK